MSVDETTWECQLIGQLAAFWIYKGTLSTLTMTFMIQYFGHLRTICWKGCMAGHSSHFLLFPGASWYDLRRICYGDSISRHSIPSTASCTTSKRTPKPIDTHQKLDHNSKISKQHPMEQWFASKRPPRKIKKGDAQKDVTDLFDQTKVWIQPWIELAFANVPRLRLPNAEVARS